MCQQAADAGLPAGVDHHVLSGDAALWGGPPFFRHDDTVAGRKRVDPHEGRKTAQIGRLECNIRPGPVDSGLLSI